MCRPMHVGSCGGRPRPRGQATHGPRQTRVEQDGTGVDSSAAAHQRARRAHPLAVGRRHGRVARRGGGPRLRGERLSPTGGATRAPSRDAVGGGGQVEAGTPPAAANGGVTGGAAAGRPRLGAAAPLIGTVCAPRHAWDADASSPRAAGGRGCAARVCWGGGSRETEKGTAAVLTRRPVASPVPHPPASDRAAASSLPRPLRANGHSAV